MKRFIKPLLLTILSLAAVTVIAAPDKVIQAFKNGKVVYEVAAGEIDYIEVNDQVNAPQNVTATASGNQVVVTWSAIANATYNLYRSADNVNFSLLAAGLTQTTYTDTKPISGTNYYRVKAVVNGREGNFSSTAIATVSGNSMESGIYLGVTGFNSNVYQYPVSYLNENSLEGYNNFINGLTMKNGTILCYSVDEAINVLQSTKLPSDLTTAAIVTFTDGIDQGSVMMGAGYDDDNVYLDAINRRIRTESVAGVPITAYSIGLRGNDVQSSAEIAKFTNTLKKIASSDNNAFEVGNMNEVNKKFKEIAEELTVNSNIQTVNITIPGVSNGQLIRFTFDNVGNATNSKLYIEGTFNLSSCSLENVKYVGMTSTSGSTIKGTQNEIFVTFSFEGLHTTDNKLIDSDNTAEWLYLSSNSWQRNSEFDGIQNAKVITERRSAAIMLVLDCSSSLGAQFSTAQTNAKNFINTLFTAFTGDTTLPNPPNQMVIMHLSFDEIGSSLVNEYGENAIHIYGQYATSESDGINGCAKFNGSSYYAVPYQESFNFEERDFTIEFLCKSNKGKLDGYVLMLGSNDADWVGFEFKSPNILFACKGGGVKSQAGVSYLMNICDDKWHHIIATRNHSSSYINLYVDGVIADSKTDKTKSIEIKTPCFIGANPTPSIFESVPPLTGILDEMYIYDYAFSTSDVVKRYAEICNILN